MAGRAHYKHRVLQKLVKAGSGPASDVSVPR